jgi:uncharacterized protein (DUF58 family)
MKKTVRLNAKILPVIASLSLLMQIIDPSRVWIILLVGLGGAWLICRWWSHGLAASLQFEREMRFGWAHVGDRLEQRFTLTNRFPFPAVWVTVHDHSTLPDHHGSLATGVEGTSTSQWKINTQCTRRGVYRLGGTTLETGDPLGIYSVILEDPTSVTLAVMPPVLPLPRFEILAGGWSGEGKPSHHALHETANLSQTRQLQPNDPMRLIHWKTTARKNELYVRQFEGAPAGEWWIVLDLHKDSQQGAGWDSTEEQAVTLAAALAAQGLQRRHAVGLSINGSEPAWLAPRRNDYQLRSLLKALAVAAPSDLPLHEYIQRAGSSLSNHCSLIVITASVDPTWPQSLLPLRWRGIRPTIFLLDPESFGGGAQPEAVSSLLRSLGILCHIIPREFLDRGQTHSGHEGEWEWRISATGKAVAVRAPQDEWRAVG